MLKKFLPLISLFFILGCSSHNSVNKNAFLSFRFDDGFYSQKKAAEILHERKMPATIFCIAGVLNTPMYLNVNDLQVLTDQGFEIGGHTLTHSKLWFMKKKEFSREVESSKMLLENLGFKVTAFSYPYGIRSLWHENIVKKNYDSASVYPWGNKGHLNSLQRSHYRLTCYSPLNVHEFKVILDKAIFQKKWLIVCFHKFSEDQPEDKFTISFEEFEKMVKLSADYQKDGKVKIGTVSEIAKIYNGKDK